MPLTAIAVKSARPKESPYKLPDERGLHLLVKPTGSKLWQMRYRFGGRESMLGLGVYPEVSLQDARARRDEARQKLRDGIDPAAQRREVRSLQRLEASASAQLARGDAVPGTFEFVAREWSAKIHRAKVAPGTAETTLGRLERDAFPWIGPRPIAEITAGELLKALRKIEDRGNVETAHRVKDAMSQVFRYAIACDLCNSNPASDLRDALQPVRETHHAAITDPAKLGALLRDMELYKGKPVTLAALKLSALLFLRPGELRHLEWSWVDESEALIRVPSMLMKRKQRDKEEGPAHIVPLARQALDVLDELSRYTSAQRFLFPSLTSKLRPMSENTVRSALRRLGYGNDEMTAHGFRASARTMIAERLHQDPLVIEAQLAHAVPDALGRAYNRTEYIEQRRAMMQMWADYLDTLRSEG